MQKAKWPLLIALAALGLAACAGNSTSSSSTEEPEPDTSSTPDTEPEPTPAWTDEQLEVIRSVVGTGHEIPFFDFGTKEVTFDVGQDTSGGNVLLMSVEGASVAELSGYIAAHVEDGYVDNTDLYSGVAPGQNILDKTFGDLSQIQAQLGFVDAEGNFVEVTEGTGTLVGYWFPSLSTNVWPGDDLAAAIEEVLSLTDITLPVPSDGADHYYLIYTAYDSYYNEYPMLEVSGNFTSYVDDLLAADWDEIEGVYSGSTYVVSPTHELGAIVNDYDFVSGTTTIQFTANSLLIDWPAEDIAEGIASLYGEGGSTLPALEGADYYGLYVDEWYYTIEVYCYGLNAVDEYIAALVEAEFVRKAFIDGEFYYEDPSSTYLVNVSYDAEYGTTDLYIMQSDGNYITEWDAATINGYVAAAGEDGVTATLPVPSFEWEFGILYNMLDTGEFIIVLQDLDDNNELVDHVADYKAQLAASADWTYLADLDIYVDAATRSVQVEVVEDTDDTDGTNIVVTPFALVQNWSDLGVEEALAGLSIEGTLPELDATWLGLESDANSVTVTAYCVDETDFDDYLAVLDAAGWGHGYHEGFGYLYWDAAKTMTLQVVYDSVNGIIYLFAQPYSLWVYDSETFANSYMLANLFYGVTLPDIVCPADTPAYFTMGSIEFLIGYVFATGLDYGSALVADGWTLSAEPDDGFDETYQKDFNGLTFYVNIDEDVANNVTYITLL